MSYNNNRNDPANNPYYAWERHANRSTTDKIAEQAAILGLAYVSARITLFIWQSTIGNLLSILGGAAGELWGSARERFRLKRKSNDYKRFLDQGHTNWRNDAA